MAKNKADEKNGPDDHYVPKTGGDEKTDYKWADLASKYESLLAKAMPLIHRFRLQLPNAQVARDANEFYKKIRDALGELGDKIDKEMRGG